MSYWGGEKRLRMQKWVGFTKENPFSYDYLNYFLIYIKSQDSVMRQEIRTLTQCFFCTLTEKLQHPDLVTYLCNFIVMHFFLLWMQSSFMYVFWFWFNILHNFIWRIVVLFFKKTKHSDKNKLDCWIKIKSGILAYFTVILRYQ